MKATVSHIEYSQSKEVTFVRCKPESVFTFQEGQFMMVSSDFIHEELGKQLKKPYSIATTNQELQDQGTIGFIVKKTRDGFMSDYLTYGVKLGDTIHLQGPVGHMKDNKDCDTYLLVSVGSGLSPIRGLYESIVAKQQFTKVANIFGERYAEHVLPSTMSEFGTNNEKIKNIVYLSQENNLPAECRLGRVQAGLDEALEFLGTTDIKVFLCGHPAMVDEVRSILEEKGVKKEQILFEKY